MARQPRLTLPGVTQHVIQRGNNRQSMFHDDNDRSLYSAWLARYARQYEVAIHAWVYMANHTHLLVTPASESGLPQMMQSLGRQYVRRFNKRHSRTGTLFEGRYKSCVVDSDQYLLACYRYIEMNPVRAALVACPGDYDWSSYGCNANGRPRGFTTPHPVYLGLASCQAARQATYRGLFNNRLADKIVEEIRGATNSGYALGSDAFKNAIESSTGRSARPGQRGRPKSN